MPHMWYIPLMVSILFTIVNLFFVFFSIIMHTSVGCSFVNVHMNMCNVLPVNYVNTEWITHKRGDRLAESPFR